MRVMFWTELFWPYIGGVEVRGAIFVRAMRERGHEFVVVTSHGSLDLPDEDDYEGIPIHRFPFQQALASRDLDEIAEARRRLTRLKRAFAPDLVHVNLTDPSVLFHLQTAQAHPAPLLVCVPVAPPDRAAGPDTLLGRALGSAAWVTANSAAILARIREVAPDVADRSSVIYNGMEEPSVRPEPLPTEAPRLLCVGRVVRQKGFDLAVAAFASVADRFPALRLVIAGDGPARPALEAQAAELGIADAVDFLGWIPPEGMPALMNSATVVAMPSRWEEAFGLVALEAALMARPVVAARAGGLPEVVAHGEGGLVVEKEDPDALAEAIAFLLENPETAVAMGRAARRRALEVFSLEKHLDAYDVLYHKLIKETAHALPGRPSVSE